MAMHPIPEEPLPRVDLASERVKGRRPGLRLFTRDGTVTLVRDNLEWVRFDLAGRWTAALNRGITHRRSLSGRVIGISSYREEEDRFHVVDEMDPPEAAELHETFRAWVSEGLAVFGESLPGAWREATHRAAAMGVGDLAADAERFRKTYIGDPITPPDQNSAVLLQSTVGCAHNTCTFCVFYRGLDFSIRSASVFERHVEAVRAFLAPTLPARRHVFLGDASALMVKPSLLARHFELAATLLPDAARPSGSGAPTGPGRPGPFSTFCDAFLTPLPPVGDLQGLREMGLGRVYLGIESGSPALLGLLRKPATPAGMLDAVRRLKDAGIAVSVIVMVGAGGHDHAQAHLQETVDLLNRMDLGPRDVVQFSEFFALPGSTYALLSDEAGVRPMTRKECREDIRRLTAMLGRPGERPFTIQMYDARQLLY